METERKCPVCGRTYKAELRRLKFGRQTTCSRACSYRFRASKLTQKIEVVCAVCGKKLYRTPSQIKGKYGSHFCSRACHYKGRSTGKSFRVVKKPYKISEEARVAWREGAKKARKTRIERDNYGHTKATRARLSHATAAAIAEGRIHKRSQIEKEVGALLKGVGIQFVSQYPMRDSGGRYVAVLDFFLPKQRTVIEVNGTFWHADPRFFPDGPVHKSQKRTAAAWRRKVRWIAKKGWKLVVLWEYDIKHLGEEYVLKAVRRATG